MTLEMTIKKTALHCEVLDMPGKKQHITLQKDSTFQAYILPFLSLVEVYELSTFVGNYGKGKTVGTLSLLPGEQTQISMKSFTHTKKSVQDSSNIFDSSSKEVSDDLEDSIQKEHATQKNDSKDKEYHAEASASASFWGCHVR